MIFEEISDPKYSVYIDETDDGLVCIEKETPDDILQELKAINAEYKKILQRDFIQFK